jgi:glycosyltransferase involved in cell wall biosynthesis
MSSPTGRPLWLMVVPWALHHAGGVNTVVRELAPALESQGFDVLVWVDSTRTDPAPAGMTLPDHVTQALPGWDAGQSRLRAVAGLALRLVGGHRQLRSVIGSRPLAVVNLHYPAGNLAFFAALRRLGLLRARLLVSLHGADLRRFEQATGWRRRLQRWLLAQADAVVTVSAAHRHECQAILPGLNADVIHNGVTAPPSAPPETPRAPIFLAVGTFEHKKGLDIVVDAYARIAHLLPDWRLVLCGRKGEALDMLRARVHALHLDARVDLNCDLTPAQVRGHYHAASIFVHAPRIEPFGLVLLEAALHGLPLVVARVGGINEIVDDDALGLRVPPEDAPALAEAMLRLAQDAGLRQRLARHAQTTLAGRFSWQRCAQHYARLGR